MKQLTARNSRVSHHDAMMALVPGVGVWQYDLANQQETWDAVLLELLGFENEEPRPELFNRLRDVDRERLRTAIAGARVDRTPFDLVFAIESKTTVKRIRIRGGFDSRSPEIVRCVCIPEHASEEGSGRSRLVFPAASRFHASHGEAAFVADEDQRLDAGTNATGQEAFFVLRLDVQGKILNFNPCFQHLTDYRLDEVRDKHWFDLFDNLSGSESRNQFDTGHGGGKGEADLPQSLVRTRLRTRNGSIKEVQWVTESLFDQAGRITGYYVIGNDAASHLELEEETRLERLIASKIQSAVFVVRVRDFEILYVNPRAIDLLSYR